MRRRALRRRRRPRLAATWRRWILENLARGADPGEIVGVLVEEGVQPALARAIVRREASSPTAEAARAWAQVARLRATLRPRQIERTTFPGVEDFYRRYWETNTAVCFEGFASDWPARRRWSPGFFAEAFGDVQIEACLGRDAAADPDVNASRHARRLSMRAFVQDVEAAGRSNDLYLIARNGNSRTEALAPLFDDVETPQGLFAPEHMRASSALWFGPAGTITALHHDTSNIMFCQIYGRKRLRLAPPDEPALQGFARGLYSHIDPLEPGPEQVEAAASLREVEVGPGDAVFIPVGWWHHVAALDVSISLALNGFARDNLYPWYLPGQSFR